MFWYDGKLVDREQIQLNINEPGLCYGATVFTTMRVYDGSITHPLTNWYAHSDRLYKAIKAFDWQQPDWQRLERGAKLMLTYFPVLRMTVFPDGKEWITGRNLPTNLKQRQTEGITAWVATDYTRNLAQYKTGNYLTPYLARNQATALGAGEAILSDRSKNWLETSTGSLWGWRDGCWYTPSLNSNILPGIARSHLLKYFRERAIEVRENTWTPEFVSTLQALFYSNCVVEIVPIVTVINGQKSSYPIKLPPSDIFSY